MSAPKGRKGLLTVSSELEAEIVNAPKAIPVPEPTRRGEAPPPPRPVRRGSRTDGERRNMNFYVSDRDLQTLRRVWFDLSQDDPGLKYQDVYAGLVGLVVEDESLIERLKGKIASDRTR